MVWKPIIVMCLFFCPPWAQPERLTMKTSVFQIYLRTKWNHVSDWSWILGTILAVQEIMHKWKNFLKGEWSLLLGFQRVLVLWNTNQLWASSMISIKKTWLLFFWNTTIPFIWGGTWGNHWQIQFNRNIMVSGLNHALNYSTHMSNIHNILILPTEPWLPFIIIVFYPKFL